MELAPPVKSSTWKIQKNKVCRFLLKEYINFYLVEANWLATKELSEIEDFYGVTEM